MFVKSLALITGLSLVAVSACDPDLSPPPPVSTACSAIRLGCFDDLARQSADAIRFRPISRWPRTTLTWRMTNRLPNFNQNIQLDIAAEAFSRWAVVSTLIFKRVDNNADITISFEQGEHGDTFALDGRGGILGHAFFPSTVNAGEIHLDFDENWALEPGDEQIDLFTVLLHDIGHVLGLDHSLDASAVMRPGEAGPAWRFSGVRREAWVERAPVGIALALAVRRRLAASVAKSESPQRG